MYYQIHLSEHPKSIIQILSGNTNTISLRTKSSILDHRLVNPPESTFTYSKTAAASENRWHPKRITEMD